MHNLKIYTSKDFNYLYNSYANNKSHWLSLFNISINHYSKIELLVMDFTSPISVSDRNRYLYALVIVSYCYIIRHLLHDKEETEIIVWDITTLLKKQSNLKAY